MSTRDLAPMLVAFRRCQATRPLAERLAAGMADGSPRRRADAVLDLLRELIALDETPGVSLSEEVRVLAVRARKLLPVFEADVAAVREIQNAARELLASHPEGRS